MHSCLNAHFEMGHVVELAEHTIFVQKKTAKRLVL